MPSQFSSLAEGTTRRKQLGFSHLAGITWRIPGCLDTSAHSTKTQASCIRRFTMWRGSCGFSRWTLRLVLWLLCIASAVPICAAKPRVVGADKTRLAVVGLDHDHVWELLKYMAAEPDAELVAIADQHPALVERAKMRVATTVKF